MANYISSTDIVVFPAGFRSQDYAESRLTTEENLTKFRQLSAYGKYNNYLIPDPDITGNDLGISGYTIIGLMGYQFIVDTSTIASGSAYTYNYAYIKLRKITDNNSVLANIANDSDVLDANGEFQGLALTDDETEAQNGYAYIELTSRLLRLSSYEVADRDSDKSIAEQLTTDTLNATTVNTVTLNVTNLNGGSFYFDDEYNSRFCFGDSGHKKFIKVSDGKITSGSFKVDNTTVDANTTVTIKSNTNNVGTTIVGPAGKTINLPENSTYGNQVLAQYTPGNSTWISFNKNVSNNTIVQRDETGSIKVNTVYSDKLKNADLIAADGEGKFIGKKRSEYAATTDDYGLVKVQKVLDKAITAFTADAGSVQGVQMDKNGKLFVRIPFADKSNAGLLKASGIVESVVLPYIPSTGTQIGLQCDLEHKAFITLPSASSSFPGGIKTGYTTSNTDRNYGVRLDSKGNAYVNVPWTGGGGSTYVLPVATADRLGGVKLGFTSSAPSNQLPLRTDHNGCAYVQVVPSTISSLLKPANLNALGGIRVIGTTGLPTSDLIKVSTQEKDLKLGVYLNADNKGYISLPTASTQYIGGVKVSDISNVSGTKVMVGIDSSQRAYVKVPSAAALAQSDIRLKENIRDFENTNSILELPIKRFDFIDGEKNQIGCIAQDLAKLYPELVVKDADGYLNIKENKLVYLLIDEVKKLKEEIADLKEKLS